MFGFIPVYVDNALGNIAAEKHPSSILKRWIEEHKRLEDDWQQNTGKALATSQYAKDSRTGGFQLRPRRELRVKEPNVWTKEVNVAFKELVHKILERIKNKLCFRWPSKMSGSLGEIRAFEGVRLASKGGATGQASKAQRDTLPPPLGVIEVIHAASIGTSVSRCKGVLSVVSVENAECKAQPKKKLKLARGSIEFEDEDLEGTTKPHDDILIVIAKINGFIVKRVLVDQGSGAENGDSRGANFAAREYRRKKGDEEDLYMYLAVSEHAVSAVLLKD
ncbi:uncharacterized protein LOC136066994 [Quercus suber]|uniref:uncharacterized protein LOC136066994 n=1 Tax=Quercus suber TaxID=58331 RepID=UPI0032DE338C